MPRYTIAIFFFFIEHFKLVPFRMKLGMKLHKLYESIDSISVLVIKKGKKVLKYEKQFLSISVVSVVDFIEKGTVDIEEKKFDAKIFSPQATYFLSSMFVPPICIKVDKIQMMQTTNAHVCLIV